jgi:hypothetical protein
VSVAEALQQRTYTEKLESWAPPDTPDNTVKHILRNENEFNNIK